MTAALAKPAIDFFQIGGLPIAEAARWSPNYQFSQFGAGESHVRLLVKPSCDVTLLFHYQGDASVICLLLLTDALRRAGAERITLWLPYMPGARQDRVCNDGEALSVRVYAQLLNSQHYYAVRVLDPHSDVTPALLDRCQVIGAIQWMPEVIAGLTGDLLLIAPDAGASKKVHQLAHRCQRPMLQAEKERDVFSGEILVSKLPQADVQDMHCVLVDDICARGRTFLPLARQLRQQGARRITLLVTHYEGHADEAQLQHAGIDQLICTNSLLPIANDFVMVLPVQRIFHV